MKAIILKFTQAILSLVLFLSSQASIAQQGGKTGAVFTGQVLISEGHSSSHDTINVVYRTTFQPAGTKEHAFKVFADKDGKFSFELPYSDTPLEMRLYVWYNDKTKIRSQTLGSYNLVDSRDRVQVNVIKNPEPGNYETFFAGIGAEKYTIAQKLEELCSVNFGDGLFRQKAVQLQLLDTVNFADKLQQYQDFTYTLLERKKRIISQYRLSDSLQLMLEYNNCPIFFEWFSFLTGIRNSKYKNDPSIRLLIKRAIDENIDRVRSSVSSYSKYCPRYIKNLAGYEYQNLSFTRNDEFQFVDLYHAFIKNYTGELRECLIANLFGQGYGWRGKDALDPGMVDSLRKDGSGYIVHANIKKSYETRMRLGRSMPVFDGIFKDTNGNSVKLSALRGKVIFIDFWFTGCGACKAFHQNFHRSGYPKLKTESDFLYVSIGLDKDRTKWLAGINSGEYSSTDYLNLHSDLGNMHPFIKYYDRITFPFVLLIDREGKIYSSDIVPNPDALVDLVRKALNAKS